jgi:hypothetical protein
MFFACLATSASLAKAHFAAAFFTPDLLERPYRVSASTQSLDGFVSASPAGECMAIICSSSIQEIAGEMVVMIRGPREIAPG